MYIIGIEDHYKWCKVLYVYQISSSLKLKCKILKTHNYNCLGTDLALSFSITRITILK